MLVVSLLLIGCTAGGSLLLVARRVVAVGRDTSATPAVAGTVVVPGKAPRGGVIHDDHLARLERARTLLGAGLVDRIVLLGSRPRGAPMSEARLGRRHLLGHGIDDGRIVIEESSRHTLENLTQLRLLLAGLGGGRLVLISNRYHLARCAAMASGLCLPLELCAAEPRWGVDRRTGPRVLSEAFLLHWYMVGRFLSRHLRYRRALDRIT